MKYIQVQKTLRKYNNFESYSKSELLRGTELYQGLKILLHEDSIKPNVNFDPQDYVHKRQR